MGLFRMGIGLFRMGMGMVRMGGGGTIRMGGGVHKELNRIWLYDLDEEEVTVRIC